MLDDLSKRLVRWGRRALYAAAVVGVVMVLLFLAALIV